MVHNGIFPFFLMEWALEAQKTRMLIWWNVWVLLAMPAIWLIWSIILYIACILSFIWRSRVRVTTASDISDAGWLAIRITLTVVFGIGLIYGFLILKTFRRYGVVMDKAWQKRIDEWVQEKARETPESPFIQPALDNSQSHRYPSIGHPLLSTYSQDTYPPLPDASDTYDPTQRTSSIKTRTTNSQSSKFQSEGITSDQDEYFPSTETTLDDCYYTPTLNPPAPSPLLPPNRPISTAGDSETPRLSIQKNPSLVVSPRRPLPPTPKTPTSSFANQSSEAEDNEEIQSLRLIPEIPGPSLGVSPPRPLPPVPETPATPFTNQSSEDQDKRFSIGAGNGNDAPESSTE